MSFRFLGVLIFSLVTLHGQERQPIDLAYDVEAKHLFVANRSSGSVSILDTVSHELIRELSLGKRLSSIAAIPQTSHFLLTDEEAHELLLLQNGEIRTRLPVPKFPVQVRVSADGSIATVTSLWSRCVSVIDIKTTELQLRTTIPLDFAPREQAFLPDQADLFIADAFGGQVAVMPLDAKGPLDFRTRSIPAHNIRGLAVLPGTGTLAVSHQRLNALGQTTIGDIHWGNLLGNHLRYLNMQSSANKNLSITRDSWRRDIGGPSNGAGDPGPIASLPDEKLAVCLTGVHAVDIVDIETDTAKRIPVGKGPSAICLIPETNLAFVANRFSDNLTLIDTTAAKALKEIPLDEEAPKPTSAQRGEQLFHDATLSHDGWLSCHSCHSDGHSNGGLADTLSDGSHGSPKRVLSLRGVHGTEPLAWKGDVGTLEEQIIKSVNSTMRGKRALTEPELADMATYLRSLTPIPPHDPGGRVEQGAKIFEELDCARCHQPPEYTTPKTYEVGLTDEDGHVAFNPPSLRGVRHRPTLFHDNSVTSLEDLLGLHRHQISEELPAEDIQALVAFLRSL